MKQILFLVLIVAFVNCKSIEQKPSLDNESLVNTLKVEAGSENVDELMKSIYVEFLKENNLIHSPEGQSSLDLPKGCSDRCCKKVLGICIKWCLTCSGVGTIEVPFIPIIGSLIG